MRVTPKIASPKRRLPNGQIIERGVPCDVPDQWADALTRQGVVARAEAPTPEPPEDEE